MYQLAIFFYQNKFCNIFFKGISIKFLRDHTSNFQPAIWQYSRIPTDVNLTSVIDFELRFVRIDILIK